MQTSEAASKGAQGALFALAGLCFLLPFVSLSCASEEAAEGVAFPQEDQELTGVQLVTGGAEREGFDPRNALGPAVENTDPEFSIPAEPFAAIALAAALVGLCFVLVASPERDCSERASPAPSERPLSSCLRRARR
jgi:hypothetical protein